MTFPVGVTVAQAHVGASHQRGASSAPSRCIHQKPIPLLPPRPQDLWRWLVTILDDVLVEKVWYRLRRGDIRGAVRAITEIITGFPGCWLSLAVLILLVVFLVRVF